MFHASLIDDSCSLSLTGTQSDVREKSKLTSLVNPAYSSLTGKL